VFSKAEIAPKDGTLSSGRLVKPALGMVWSQSIFQRLTISRKLGVSVNVAGSAGPVGGMSDAIETNGARELTVGFAPHLPPLRCSFVISEAGVSGLA